MPTLTDTRDELDDPIELELQLRAWWRNFCRIVSAGCWLYTAVALWMLYGPPSW